jgi:glycosyltransferase involved in cell wall biosynthesis
MAINRHVYHLFAAEGWKVEIVAPKQLRFPAGERQAEPPRPEDPTMHFLPLQGQNPRTYSFEGLEELLSKKKPRIVLLDNDPVSSLALFSGKWCRNNNARIFCISCENLPLDISSSFKRRGWKGIPAILIKRFLVGKTKKIISGVFTLSNDGKQIFLKEGFKQVEKMPLGFDPAYFHPDAAKREIIRSQLGISANIIAYFGRLTREKGVHILIQALQDLKGKNWYLMMDDFDEYASGYNQEIHRLINEAKISDRVIYINPSHFEIASYMNAADIVVVPSISVPHWKEQYGRVAAEAMACGTKVIASDSGALPELLNNNGWLFPEGDVEALRILIDNLLSAHGAAPEKKQEVIASYAKNELSIFKQKEIMEASFNLAPRKIEPQR